jgi:hypothetical protein
VSLPPEDDPKFLKCYVFSENLIKFNFGKFPNYPLVTNTLTISKGPLSINLVDLNQVNVEARQLVHLSLSTDQETFDSGACGQRD